MKKLTLLLILFFVITISVYSQDNPLLSLSEKNNFKSTSVNSSFINLKLNYYLKLDDIHSIDYGYGFLGEAQFMTSRNFGWLANINVLALVDKDHDGIRYTKFGGVILMAGPKVYFNNSDIRGYASFGLGAGIGGSYSSIAISPALGMEYKLNRDINLNFEVKTNGYTSSFGMVYSQFFNAGIGINL